MSLNILDLAVHQRYTMDFIITNPKSFIMLDMGAGKTPSTLFAYSELLFWGNVKKVLVISHPSIVNNVWHNEINKWDGLKHLTYTIVNGTPAKRLKQFKEAQNKHFTMLSIYNLDWAIKEGLLADYDGLIIDESTMFKSYKSVRFKQLKTIVNQFNYVTLLSGTPKPNTITDLWSQLFLLDGGKRLGKNISAFRRQYMTPGYIKHTWIEKDNSLDEVTDKIDDLCFNYDIVIDKPECFMHFLEVELDSKTKKKYDSMKKNLFISDDFEKINKLKKEYDRLAKSKDNVAIEIWAIEDELSELLTGDSVINGASQLYSKCLQFSSGFTYDIIEDDTKPNKIKSYTIQHDSKIKYLKTMLNDIYNNENFIIIYNLQAEKDIIMKAIKNIVVYDKRKSAKIINDWNDGKIKYLLTHVSSLSHGVNLQFGGNNMIYYSPCNNLETYLQMNKRLDRKGQTKNVNIFHLYTTIDEMNVYKALEDKNISQNRLLNQFMYNTIKG